MEEKDLLPKSKKDQMQKKDIAHRRVEGQPPIV